MNINEIKKAILYCFNNPSTLIPHVESSPGIGKSDIVKEIAIELAQQKNMEFYEGPENFDENKFGLIDMRLNQLDISDLTGLAIPSVDKKSVQFTASPYIPNTGQGVLFVDEIRQVSTQNQSLASQLFLGRRIGTNRLGDGWHIVTAANRTTDRASAHRMPTHIGNRLKALELDFHLDSFVDYMHSIGTPDVGIAFAKWKPDILQSFDANKEINCTPRSYIGAMSDLNAPPEIRFNLIRGCIGEGPAAELLGFDKVWKNMPSLEDIINYPKDTKVPEAADTQFALANMLGMNVTEEIFSPIMEYLKRLPDREYQTVFVKTALGKNSNLADTDVFSKYLEDNIDILV